MNRLRVKDGCFIHPDTYEPLRSIEVVITDRGVLSRNYYKDDNLVCWSVGCDFPHEDVANKQAPRCLDCDQSIKVGWGTAGAPCKYFTLIKVAFLDSKYLHEIRLGALSLFSKEDNRMSLYKYEDHLKRNREKIGNVLTEIYFVEHGNTYKMLFKPVRPLTEEELENIQQLEEAVQPTPFTEQHMASKKFKSHVIRGVTAMYPRINQPYHWSESQNKSVPCSATQDGAAYEMSFTMNKDQAAELYALMKEAYMEGREKSWPEEFPKAKKIFNKQEDGTYLAKTSIKAQYNGKLTNPPKQYDSQEKLLGEDFMLTTGSTVNIAVDFFPHKMNGGNVALWLRMVQVIKYVPYEAPSPFGKEEGFSVDDGAATPFGVDNSGDGFEADDDNDDDDVEEVKTPSKRKNQKPQADDDDDDIEDLISDWSK